MHFVNMAQLCEATYLCSVLLAPSVTNVHPLVGPLSGGTVITVEGEYLELFATNNKILIKRSKRSLITDNFVTVVDILIANDSTSIDVNSRSVS